VGALGFLLIVSLAVSARLTAFANYLDTLPVGAVLLSGLNFAISLILFAVLFGAIYKVLPDRTLQWKDVIVGALMTSALFNIGKTFIGWYIGSSAVASSYGAAGGLIVLLLWVYYSAQIFLFGAEFTKTYANAHGSRRKRPSQLTAPLRPRSRPVAEMFTNTVILCGPERSIIVAPSNGALGRTSRHRREATKRR
jgi:membrane protein